MKVKDFFTIEAPPSTKTVVSKNYNEPVMKKKQPPAPPNKKMSTISLYVEEPNIILLEDMDDINSNCIILNVIII